MLTRLFVVMMIVMMGTSAYAASKKKSGDSDSAVEKAWDKDPSLTKLDTNESYTNYAVNGTYKIEPNGNTVIWIKSLIKAPTRASQEGKFKKAHRKMSKMEFNCSSNLINITRLAWYDKDGNILHTADDLDSWREPIPGSIGEYYLETFCNVGSSTQKDNNSNTNELKAMEIPAGTGIRGRVVETMTGGGYTYALILHESDSTTHWIALPEVNISVGDTIEYPETPPLTNFESKTLNRKFAILSFVPGIRVYK